MSQPHDQPARGHDGTRPHDLGEVHEHDLGLQHDLGTLRRRGLGRRGVLGIVGGLGVAAVAAGCGAGGSSASSTATSSARPEPGRGPGGGPMGGEASVAVAEGEMPEETAGPYPADGSNGPDVLGESGVVRSDLTHSFGSATGVADGVPLTLRFKVYDLTGDEVALLPGAALYAWHCDRDGNYSMYDGDAVDQNYLRGVQETDADGWVEFRTIFPGCYAGRWPHVHFEVYESLDSATSASTRLRTSQLALPQEVCEQVYATEGYEASAGNLAGVSLDSDGVFSDGWSLQLARLTGSVERGYVATLSVPV